MTTTEFIFWSVLCLAWFAAWVYFGPALIERWWRK